MCNFSFEANDPVRRFGLLMKMQDSKSSGVATRVHHTHPGLRWCVGALEGGRREKYLGRYIPST